MINLLFFAIIMTFTFQSGGFLVKTDDSGGGMFCIGILHHHPLIRLQLNAVFWKEFQYFILCDDD